ncbi:hypothetical protein [Algoriphagus terrigena]|uniref:hypothetical protein n=1 Tax=Algoriphagus terrigena TaxID=344884 RepID=UPI000408D8AE|nr:hypothetical protein [Algoriphagus terrigena]
MEINSEQFQALGKELEVLLARVERRLYRLMNGYSPTRLKDVNKGRRIKSALERAIGYYNLRDARLWDEIYEINREGIKLKSFSLPIEFSPLKLLTKGLNITIGAKRRQWLPGDIY